MTPEPILRLHNSLVRAYKPGDVESLSKAADSPEIARWMNNTFPSPYTPEEAEKWIGIANSDSPSRNFAICLPDDSAVVGGIGLKTRADIHHRTMEIGYWVSPGQSGRGIATEAVKAFSDWAFASFPQLLRLEAEVFEGNGRSIRVLERAGFAHEATHRMAIEKNGVMINSLIYCRFRQGQ